MDYQANVQEIYTIPNSQISREWVGKLFSDLIESKEVSDETISQYVSPNYIQKVDGKTLNFSEYVSHMKSLKASIQSVKITIERCMIQGNAFFTVHTAEAVKKNGDRVVAKVIGYFEVKDGKLIFCDELTKTLVGSKEDEDLGSRTHSKS